MTLMIVSIWLDRIPFTLIFGVATTSDMFEERLPSYVIRYLSGQRFDVSNTGELFESIFWATIEERSVYLRLGPSLLSGIISRQSDHIQSIEEFQNTIKVGLNPKRKNNMTLIRLVLAHVTLLRQPSQCLS